MNETSDITTKSLYIKSILRGYNANYSNKFDNLDRFLKRHKASKLIQEEIGIAQYY